MKVFTRKGSAAMVIRQSQLHGDTVYHTQRLFPACSDEIHLPVPWITAKLFGTALAACVQMDLLELVSHPFPPMSSQGPDIYPLVVLVVVMVVV